MVRPMRLASVAFLSSFAATACGGAAPSQDATARGTKGAGDAAAGAGSPAAAPPPAPADAAASGSARGDGGDAQATSGDTAQAGGAPGPSAPPCEVRWDDGPRIRLQPTDQGGSFFLDRDGDGTNDTCATFKRAPGDGTAPAAITYLRLDEGCDRSAERIVRVRPAAGGLARVTVESDDQVQTLAGLPLPVHLAATPYYLLDRTPAAYTVTRTCDVPARVAAKAPPRRSVTFVYDGDPCKGPSPLVRIEDDRDGDGEVDTTLRFEWDDTGRITTVARADRNGAATARVRYDCGR